ncbi:caspase 20, apoptosis-related cysteine peptidase [Sardina pilchardus]|uniref:caspase 20, apoptosis-related cysteine peptidase n=1 Tax=Sardina pilchardus TaxID=27697 RepID=UPI002E15641A
MDFIRSNKTTLIDLLSTDASFILQHVQRKNLITPREYRNLHGMSQNGEKTIIELLDKLMNKNDEYCINFISLLREREIVDTFPSLKELLNAQENVPRQEVAQLPATDNPDTNSDNAYTMINNPRGLCIIINNENFQTLSTRRGSSEDADALRKVFTWLSFEVEYHQDLTKDKMKSAVQEGSQRADGDCFVCCVMSHGETNGVFGCDSGVMTVEEMITPFKGNNCPRLAGKPKLFFIQACRGRLFQNEAMIRADSSREDNQDLEMDAYPGEMISIPAEADFLVSMATVNEYFSFRNNITGSWFIQSLCKQLKEGVLRRDDILTILTYVNDDVCREEGNIRGKKAKQVPDQSFRLRKRLVFPVPNSPYL